MLFQCLAQHWLSITFIGLAGLSTYGVFNKFKFNCLNISLSSGWSIVEFMIGLQQANVWPQVVANFDLICMARTRGATSLFGKGGGDLLELAIGGSSSVSLSLFEGFSLINKHACFIKLCYSRWQRCISGLDLMAVPGVVAVSMAPAIHKMSETQLVHVALPQQWPSQGEKIAFIKEIGNSVWLGFSMEDDLAWFYHRGLLKQRRGEGASSKRRCAKKWTGLHGDHARATAGEPLELSEGFSSNQKDPMDF